MKKNILKKQAFTLIELLVVISIIGILATLAFMNFDTSGAKDSVRTKTIKDVQVYLEDFKQKVGVYPNSNSSSRKYPTSGCSVSGFDTLISCFVARENITEDTETYNSLAFDPMEGEFNEFDQEYAFLYGTANNGNKYKVCALMGKQDNDDYKGLDGNDAQKGSRYFCVTSANTKLSDVTTVNK